MRTLVFGAYGQLGRDLVALFARAGETRGVDLPETDVADERAVAAALRAAIPDLVINAAAFTDVEGAEDQREKAFRANKAGARIVARAAAERGVPVVYISTDFVFDGTAREPYAPDAPVAPRGVYAESKAAGETVTREANDRHFIVRTAWLYGPGGNNFVEKILRAAQTRPELRVVDDEVGSPTHTLDLAEAIRALAQTEAYGMYHAVNAGSCSRYAFAGAILEAAGLATPIAPCRAAEYPSKAPRPAYSVLSNEKLERATGHVMRPWEEALKMYMDRRKETTA